MHVGWFLGWYSRSQWMRSHPCLGEKACVVGSPGQRTSVRCPGSQLHRQGLPPSDPQLHHCSERFHSPMTGKASSPLSTKSFVKSFHPVRWVLGPLTRVDILICCTKTVPPLCQSATWKNTSSLNDVNTEKETTNSNAKSNLVNWYRVCVHNRMILPKWFLPNCHTWLSESEQDERRPAQPADGMAIMAHHWH